MHRRWAGPQRHLRAAGPPAVSTTAVRANRLAAAIRPLVNAKTHVVVLCCDAHLADAEVGQRAAAMLGIASENGSVAAPCVEAGTSSDLLVLACAEGTSAWRAARGRGILVGDGAGERWWRAMEAQQAFGTPVRTDVGDNPGASRRVHPTDSPDWLPETRGVARSFVSPPSARASPCPLSRSREANQQQGRLADVSDEAERGTPPGPRASPR